MAINAQQLQGSWNELKGQVKERWNQLTDEDLQLSGANVDQLVGRIQQRTGEGREAIEQYLGDLTSRASSTIAQASQAIGSYSQQAGERLREGYDQLSEQARQRLGHAEDLVRHNPGQSVAAAFGVGIVVGLVVGLAMRSR